MSALRVYLASALAALGAYTAYVVAHHGLASFVSVALAAVASLSWTGQFVVDFSCYLGLSALWVAWRHRFRPAGLALAAGAFVGGALFLTVYLLVETRRAGGDVARLLLGERAAERRASGD